MTFQNPFFFAFFLIIFILYYKVKKPARWIVLLVGSLFFYATLGVYYLFIPLLIVVSISFVTGKRVYQTEGTTKQRWFILGTAVNVLTLVFFRFYPVVMNNLTHLTIPSGGMLPTTIAAFGVSFYVFQAISYLVDVYLDRQEPEMHLGYFTLYISFFPKIMQGPIERGRDLIPQLHQQDGFNYANARAGALQFTYGLFKKIVIADRLGVIVDPVYANVTGYSGLALLFATFVYAFQLYYDFSGYTDMALGVARIFNIHLTNNFNLPYLATSISEFWRRWHISFSRWIMDYLFKPIQLSLRKWGRWGVVVALLITFFLSGLWHGATWGFVVWGLLHGVYLSISMLYSPYRKKLYKRLGWDKSWLAKAWQIFLTFNLVSFAWIFFRANSLSDAFYIIKNIVPWRLLDQPELVCTKLLGKQFFASFAQGSNPFLVMEMEPSKVCKPFISQFDFYPNPFHVENIWITIMAIVLVILIGIFGKRLNIFPRPAWLRWLVYLSFLLFILAAALLLQIPNPDAAPYLYFNF